MGLDAKIRASVDKAFRRIDDLLSIVVFNNKTVTEFDFTGGSVESVSSTLTTKGYIMKRKILVDGVRVTRLTLLMKTEGYVFNGHTDVTVVGVPYKCSVLESDAYVTTLLLEGIS